MKAKTLFMLTTILITSASFRLNHSVLPSGDEIAQKVNARDEGDHVIQDFNMVLTDKNGKKQERETKIYRKDYANQRKSIIVYLNPTNVKGTAFMSFDYFSSTKPDDQWLYLPALRKTRRISSSNRGDYFLGTDFTYEDIKLGTKMSISDYQRKTIGEEMIDGHKCYLVESTPVSDKIARELTYSKVRQWIDAEIWITRKAQYWDVAGNLLKTTFAKEIKKVQNIWTIQLLDAENHKTGHKTNIRFRNTTYNSNVNDNIFTEESLIRGVN